MCQMKDRAIPANTCNDDDDFDDDERNVVLLKVGNIKNIDIIL